MEERLFVSGIQGTTHYSATIHALRQIQTDYRQAIEELQNVSLQFSEREAMASRRLDRVLEALNQGETTQRIGLCLGDPQQTPYQYADPVSPVLRLVATQAPSPTLEVYTLGSFRVRARRRTANHWPSAKAKSLLKYLVAHQGRPIPREVLMEILWPGCDPQLANNNLKAAVRVLRQVLSPSPSHLADFPWVIFQNGNYMINPEAYVWTDTWQFEHHWNRGCQLERVGETSRALTEFETAEDIYRGDYLEDDPFEDWTLLRRESLKDMYLTLLGKISDHFMQIDDCQNAITYCQKIIARDCCREDAYRRLMICYQRLGSRNRALEWYRICEKTVKAELDLLPDRQTQAIYQKLLGDEIL